MSYNLPLVRDSSLTCSRSNKSSKGQLLHEANVGWGLIYVTLSLKSEAISVAQIFVT